MKRPASLHRVAVLCGGFSKEREISLVSGGAADRAEVETLRFLAGPVAQPWLRHKLGL